MFQLSFLNLAKILLKSSTICKLHILCWQPAPVPRMVEARQGEVLELWEDLELYHPSGQAEDVC